VKRPLILSFPLRLLRSEKDLPAIPLPFNSVLSVTSVVKLVFLISSQQNEVRQLSEQDESASLAYALRQSRQLSACPEHAQQHHKHCSPGRMAP
jgi:hypothetical protein